LPDETHSICREVPEEFLRPESGWAIGAMSFSATGILVGILHILCKIYFPILNDLESYISILVSHITYKLIIVSYTETTVLLSLKI